MTSSEERRDIAREQIKARQQAARDAILAELIAAGHEAEWKAHDFAGQNLVIDGEPGNVDVTYKSKSWYGPYGNEPLQVRVGSYGNITTYPEGKNGLNIAKIAAAAVKKIAERRAADLAAQARHQREKEAAEAAQRERNAAKDMADALGIPSRHVNAGGSGFHFNAQSLTEAQLRAIVAAAIECGAIECTRLSRTE